MSRYRKFLDKLRNHVGYWREVALTEFVTDLSSRMEDMGLTRKDLADKLGCSRAHVTQTLRGDGNLTLETLVQFARAVDGVVHIHIADRGVATTWIDRECAVTSNTAIAASADPDHAHSVVIADPRFRWVPDAGRAGTDSREVQLH